jgi:hypothetical protein
MVPKNGAAAFQEARESRRNPRILLINESVTSGKLGEQM